LVEKTFLLEVPDSFQTIREGDSLQCVSREPAGVIVLTSEEVTDTDSLPSLSRMLAGFLTRSGHPVATDELLRVSSVPGCHGFSWQYCEGGNYHRFWLFGNESAWLLLTFVCPEAERASFQDVLSEVVNSIRLRSDGSDS